MLTTAQYIKPNHFMSYMYKPYFMIDIKVVWLKQKFTVMASVHKYRTFRIADFHQLYKATKLKLRVRWSVHTQLGAVVIDKQPRQVRE